MSDLFYFIFFYFSRLDDDEGRWGEVWNPFQQIALVFVFLFKKYNQNFFFFQIKELCCFL